MADRIAEQIRRATLASVAERNKLNHQAVAKLRALYERAARELEEQIAAAANSDGRVPLERMSGLLGQVREQIRALGGTRDQLLRGTLTDSAALGSAPFLGRIDTAELFRINTRAVEFVEKFVAADGLNLSSRLWRLDQGATEHVADRIKFAIIRGDGAHHAAMAAMGGVPPDLQEAIAGANGRTLGRSIREVMTGAPDPQTGLGEVWQAERVFRTEINRAHGEAYMDGAFATPGVVGVRFMLSPRHPKPDICDKHAEADLHGLGAGVYPSREACPWPAHPNTFSYVRAVFGDNAPQAPAQPVQRAAPSVPQSFEEYVAAGHAIGDRLLNAGPIEGFLQRLHESLTATRPMGADIKLIGGGRGAELVQAAAKMFPDSWKRAADALGPLHARFTRDRGWQITVLQEFRNVRIPLFGVQSHVEAGTGWLAVDDFSTAAHELTHRMQAAMPQLDDIFQMLHGRRTEGTPLRYLRQLTGKPFGADEVTREDHYYNPYQGRTYAKRAGQYNGRYGALEVMTMAFEPVLGGNTKLLEGLLDRDREMFDLVLGLLYHYEP